MYYNIFIIIFCLMTQSVFAQTYVGVIYPDNDLTLALGVSGPIADIKVKEGSVVEKNAMLLMLDIEKQKLELERRKIITDDKSELKSLTERLSILRVQYKSLKNLYDETQSITKDEVSRLELEVINVKGMIAQLKLQEEKELIEYQQIKAELEERSLKSPSSGIITRVALQKGEWVKAGEPVIQLIDVSKVFVKFNLPDAKARKLKNGQEAKLKVEGVGFLNAKISYISPVADPASGLVEVKLEVDNQDQQIRPGTKASAEL